MTKLFISINRVESFFKRNPSPSKLNYCGVSVLGSARAACAAQVLTMCPHRIAAARGPVCPASLWLHLTISIPCVGTVPT